MFGTMKDWSLSALAVLVLALAIGLAFRWLYPHVTPTPELAGLFVFIALGLKLLTSRLWAAVRRPRTPPAQAPPEGKP
jgi:hypothetical protein